MADEVDVAVNLPGSAAAVLAQWRETPPGFITDHGFRRVDESYESLVFEADVTTRAQKLLMFGMASTLYRITITFRDDPTRAGATRVTILGQAPEQVQAEMLAFVEAQL
jgi:hypothetical protein